MRPWRSRLKIMILNYCCFSYFVNFSATSAFSPVLFCYSAFCELSVLRLFGSRSAHGLSWLDGCSWSHCCFYKMTVNDFERTMSSNPRLCLYPGIQHRLAPSMAFSLVKMADCGMIRQYSVQELDIRLVGSFLIDLAFLGLNSSDLVSSICVCSCRFILSTMLIFITKK